MMIGVVLLLLSCGGGRKGSPHPPSPGVSPGSPESAQQGAHEISLSEALSQLDALATPEGVDESVFAQLKEALGEALRAKGVSKLASKPPTGASNKVNDLELHDNGDGTYSLTWSYRN